MAFDEKLAERLRKQFQKRSDIEEKKMFGGLCFMVSNHMCCGIVDDMLMARVGGNQYEKALENKYTKEMDFTGKPMKGWVMVAGEGYKSKEDLRTWLEKAKKFAGSLPAK